MKLKDLEVGKEYCVGHRGRRRATIVRLIPSDSRGKWAKAEVEMESLRRDGSTVRVDVPTKEIVCLWSEEQARRDKEAALEDQRIRNMEAHWSRFERARDRLGDLVSKDMAERLREELGGRTIIIKLSDFEQILNVIENLKP